MQKDDGGPAFPRPLGTVNHCDSNGYSFNGMTMRDYFAGQALSGHCSQNFLATSMNDAEGDLAFVNAAAFAYRCADAMLKEREK